MYLSKYTCTFYLYLQNLKTISCAYILQKLCISQTLRFMKKARNLCVVNTLILCPSVFPVIHNLDEHCADVINYFTLLLFIRKNYTSGYSALEKQLFSPKGIQEILWKCSCYYSLCISQITSKFSYNLNFHTKLLLLCHL